MTDSIDNEFTCEIELELQRLKTLEMKARERGEFQIAEMLNDVTIVMHSENLLLDSE